MRNVLLRHAIPLVRIHGFTRQALSVAATSLPTPHPEPLSDTAVSALFGSGDEARKTLIQAWLDEGISRMGRRENDEAEKIKGSVSVKDALKDRLRWNEPVLHHLPEVCLIRMHFGERMNCDRHLHYYRFLKTFLCWT